MRFTVKLPEQIRRDTLNQCTIDLCNDHEKSTKLATGLPIAFEMASLELPSGNPAVGFLREHAIIGFFTHLFGDDRIGLPEHGNSRGFDIVVCDKPLSIKTVTGDGEVKASGLWTPTAWRMRLLISYARL